MRIIQSKAAEMEEDLNTALQEKQVRNVYDLLIAYQLELWAITSQSQARAQASQHVKLQSNPREIAAKSAVDYRGHLK